MFRLFILLGGKGGQRERKSRSPWIICSCLRVLWPWFRRCLSELKGLRTPGKNYVVVSTKKQEFLFKIYLVKKKKYYY